MALIQLTKGQFALVDDEDYDYLTQWKWWYSSSKNTGYAATNYDHHTVNGVYKKKQMYMHRLLLNFPEGLEVDHINRNGLDNRKENLRIVTRRQNCHNIKNQREFIGAQKSSEKCYTARFWFNGRTINAGSYQTPEDAHNAYVESLKRLTVNI